MSRCLDADMDENDWLDPGELLKLYESIGLAGHNRAQLAAMLAELLPAAVGEQEISQFEAINALRASEVVAQYFFSQLSPALQSKIGFGGTGAPGISLQQQPQQQPLLPRRLTGADADDDAPKAAMSDYARNFSTQGMTLAQLERSIAEAGYVPFTYLGGAPADGMVRAVPSP